MRGPTFIAVHELLDKVVEIVEGYADLFAERAAALGAIAEGTVQVPRRALASGYLPPTRRRPKEHLFAVAAMLAASGQSVREAIGEAASFGDADTTDLFIEVSRGIDHKLWFVVAHTPPK